jgi:signal transduction histidine kinase/ligand-binding sensor domain-containing protein
MKAHPSLFRVMAHVAAGLLATLLIVAPASALDPDRSVAQFHHTKWSIFDGFPAVVTGVAQTPDGFLWLASPTGLFKFDGVRAERYGGTELAGPGRGMVSTANGDLWVGLFGANLARINRRGELATFTIAPTPGARSQVLYLAPDPDGSIWVGTRDQVLNFDGRRWRVIGSPWPPAMTWLEPGGVWGLALARDGTLWAKNLIGLYYLRRGAAAFVQATGYAGSIIDFARDRDGRLWTADSATHRFYALPDLDLGRPVPTPQFGAPAPPQLLGHVLMDRDGSVWNTNSVTGGLYRTASMRSATDAERYTVPQGLLTDVVNGSFEDREGDIWIGSAYGLERFRPANIVIEPDVRLRAQATAVTANEQAAYVYTGVRAPVADPLEAGGRLYRIRPGQRPELLSANIGQLQDIAAMPSGDLALASEGRLLRWRDGRATPIPVLPEMEGGHVQNLAATPNDGLLVSIYQRGVYRLESGHWAKLWSATGSPRTVPEVAIDRAGAIWLIEGFADGRIIRIDGDRRMEFPVAVKSGLRLVRATLADRDGMMFVGNAGVGRFDGRTLQVLPVSRAPIFAMASGIAQTSDGNIWILTQAGIVRVARTTLLRALARSDAKLDYQLFDAGDGFKGAAGDTFNKVMQTGPDGRIWFTGVDHAHWIDPKRLFRNRQPPPVVIRSVTANGRVYDKPTSLTLSPGTSQLQIDYTALSLAAPERVRFRYRLEGVDKDWVDAGGRRQAFYTNLQPGDYRFRVIAANGDGVWNTAGATFRATIRPTFLQTWVFKALVALAAAALLWVLYRLRLRQVSDRIRARLAERMDERERIARELHDTLLQGVQGLSLRLQAFAAQMPAEEPTRRLMEQALDRADEVLAEGRDRVRNLRASRKSGDLPEALTLAAERLSFDPTVTLQVKVEGVQRALHPVVFDEVMGIAGEALFNAFTHAQADRVTAEICYERNQLVVRIRDNGGGMENDVLEHGREGHFGLAGMRERAQKIRGQLSIRSRPGEGVELALTIPASHAYARARWRPFAAPRLELED